MNPLQEAACDEQDRRTSLSLADRSTGLNAGQDCVTPKIVDPECAELLHGLNNVLVGMLLNAQVLEWKLPSYSRLKRNLHEIERNAQRGGELVRRLLKRFELPHSEQLTGGNNGAEAAAIDPAVIASANVEPDSAGPTEVGELELPGPTATSQLKIGKRCLTHLCDARTSVVFPKRDNGHAGTDELVCTVDHPKHRSKGKKA